MNGTAIVSDRIELEPALEPFRISSRVPHEICSHALEATPEECCGLVLGREGGPFLRSVRISNVMTKMHLDDPIAFPRDANHAYYMAEVEYQRALEEAEDRGEYVSAIYHSHVEQGCYLSQDDIAFAVHPLFPFPEASQIVVSVLGDRIAEVGLFERVGVDRKRFVGCRLEAAP